MTQATAPDGALRGVLYDHDGTLVDSLAVVVAATNAVLEANGRPTLPAPEIISAMVLPTAPRMGLHAGTADPAQQARLRDEFYAIALTLGPAHTALYPGVAEAVAGLDAAGRPQAVISNNQGVFVRAVLAALGIARHFRCAYGEEDFAAPKPDPSGLLRAAATLGLPPGRCCYVGDTVGDAQAARAAGMPAIGCAWGIHGREGLRGHGFAEIIDHPSALTAAVARL